MASCVASSLIRPPKPCLPEPNTIHDDHVAAGVSFHRSYSGGLSRNFINKATALDCAKDAFAAWRIRIGAQTGTPNGLAKYWGTLTIVAPDELSGTMNSKIYAQSGSLIGTFGGISVAKRIEVEIDD